MSLRKYRQLAVALLLSPFIRSSALYAAPAATTGLSSRTTILARPASPEASTYPLQFWSMGLAMTTFHDGTIDNILAGSEVLLEPTIVNNGYVPATAMFDIDIPSGAAYVGVFSGDVTCTGSSTVSCTLPSIAPGAKFIFDLRMRVPGTVGNARFLSALRDPQAGRYATFGETLPIGPRDAQLTIQVIPSATTFTPGGSGSATIRVKNSGHDYTARTTVTASVSTALTVKRISTTASATCTTTPVRCGDFVIEPGATAEFTTDLNASTAIGPAWISATVSSFSTAPHTADATIMVGDELANTVTTLTADRSSAGPGQTVTYTAKVANAGPGDAHSLKMRIVLNSGGTITSASGTSPTTCAIQQQPYIVDCDTPTLARGATAIAAVSVSAPQAPASVGLSVTTSVLNGATHSVSASTPVVPTHNGLALSVDATSIAATAGQRAVLQFEVTNAGSADATDVVFDASLTPGLVLDSLTTTAGSCIASHCAIGLLSAGATVHITGSAFASSAGTALFDATVACAAEDGAPENDRVSIVIRVAAARGRGARH